jgi:predicted ATP-grasp superfamily ATP-dependent carboligase
LRANCLEIASRTGQLPIIVEVVPERSDRCIGVTLVVDQHYTPVRAYCVRRLQLYPYFLGRQFVHPYELGANVHCESVIDDEAVEAATRLVRHARFHGVITVEFRRDPTDGSLKLIKTDPRVVRATALSTALNLDVPTTLYDVFSGRPVRSAGVYQERIGWLWPTWYLETLWHNRRRAALAAQLLALARDIWKVRTFAYLSLRDPFPALVDGWRMGQKWGQAARLMARRFLPRDSASPQSRAESSRRISSTTDA